VRVSPHAAEADPQPAAFTMRSSAADQRHNPLGAQRLHPIDGARCYRPHHERNPRNPYPAQVWLYDGGDWQLIENPVRLSSDRGDIFDKYAEADYCSRNPIDRYPVLEVPYSGTEPLQQESGLSLWVREEHPQCVITIDWSVDVRVVYAARFPDGLDLMAKWAPIFHNGARPEQPAS
jgi:hypothetical protein